MSSVSVLRRRSGICPSLVVMLEMWVNCMVVSFLFRHGRQRERLQVGGPEQLPEHTDHSIQCTLRQAIEFISRFIICVFCTSSDLACTALKVAMRVLQRPVWLRPMPAQPAQPRVPSARYNPGQSFANAPTLCTRAGSCRERVST